MSTRPSCYDLLDAVPPACPGCQAHAPAWRWVRIDGLRILTHDGDLICPKDRSFGYAPVPAPLPVVEPLAVAA
ncbi:hypothetical protein ACFV0T_06950 [Streptomyces sp. NPDC059582]|uniref:hypothetical protein n=1 Tax=Streptomyces sp. NPDC059582 TaxID=3346875 RepID=UPI00367FB1FD